MTLDIFFYIYIFAHEHEYAKILSHVRDHVQEFYSNCRTLLLSCTDFLAKTMTNLKLFSSFEVLIIFFFKSIALYNLWRFLFMMPVHELGELTTKQQFKVHSLMHLLQFIDFISISF